MKNSETAKIYFANYFVLFPLEESTPLAGSIQVLELASDNEGK